MDFAEKRALLAEIDPEILLADGFEGALLGYCTGFGPVKAVYDHRKCIAIMEERDGMTYEDAVEFFEFNIAGAYMGKHTPQFVYTFDDGSRTWDKADRLPGQVQE